MSERKKKRERGKGKEARTARQILGTWREPKDEYEPEREGRKKVSERERTREAPVTGRPLGENKEGECCKGPA